jgi:hypothetical protein
MTKTTSKLATLLLGATVLTGIATADREERPAAGVRKAIELIAEKEARRLAHASGAAHYAM